MHPYLWLHRLIRLDRWDRLYLMVQLCLLHLYLRLHHQVQCVLCALLVLLLLYLWLNRLYPLVLCVPLVQLFRLHPCLSRSLQVPLVLWCQMDRLYQWVL